MIPYQASLGDGVNSLTCGITVNVHGRGQQGVDAFLVALLRQELSQLVHQIPIEGSPQARCTWDGCRRCAVHPIIAPNAIGAIGEPDGPKSKSLDLEDRSLLVFILSLSRS